MRPRGKSASDVERRNPKAERIPKVETRNGWRFGAYLLFDDFRISFGFCHSVFGFWPEHANSPGR
jgi:hypothetical protein